MKKSRDIESLIVDALFDDSRDDAEQSELDSALENDSARTEDFDKLERTMRVVESAGLRQDPGEEYWRDVWPDFQNQLMGREKKSEKRFFNFGMAWEHFWRPAIQVAVVGAMLVVGIFIGKQLTSMPSNGTPEALQTDVEAIAPYEQEIDAKKQEYFLTAAGDSFERSSRLLNDFMELTPDQVVGTPGVISQRREEILVLIDEIVTIRESVNDPRLNVYSPLLDEIELTIGEIAGIGGDPSDIRFEITALQEGIRKRALLDRLNNIRISIRISNK